jgi:hypothetical protein
MTTIETGLFEAGRPVLIAPPSPPQRIGENILIDDTTRFSKKRHCERC